MTRTIVIAGLLLLAVLLPLAGLPVAVVVIAAPFLIGVASVSCGLTPLPAPVRAHAAPRAPPSL